MEMHSERSGAAERARDECDHSFTVRGAAPCRVAGAAPGESTCSYRTCLACGTRKPESSLTPGERARADVLTYRGLAEAGTWIEAPDAEAALVTAYGVTLPDARRIIRGARSEPWPVPLPDDIAASAGTRGLHVWSAVRSGHRLFRIDPSAAPGPAVLPGSPAESPAAGHGLPGGAAAAGPVTCDWFEDESEARFELPRADGYASVIAMPGRAWLAELWVHPRARSAGRATVLLDAVTGRFGHRAITLSAEPFSLPRSVHLPGGDLPGLPAASLAAWYGRHGFRPAPGPEKNLMTRPPHARHGRPRTRAPR